MYKKSQPNNSDEDTEENYELREKMDSYLNCYPNNLPRLMRGQEDE